MKHKSLTLSDVQIRYNPETADITLTSKDPAVKKKPFIITLSGDSPTYDTLLELLQEAGLVDLAATRISKSIVIPDPRKTDSSFGEFRTRIRIGETFLEEPVELDLANTPHTLITGATGSGKSILQRLVAAHALLHKDEIELYGIDLKGVELNPYFLYSRENLATTLDDALRILDKIDKSIRERCEALKSVKENSFSAMESKAIYLMVDDLGMLLHNSGVKNEESRLEEAKRLIIRENILRLARLGRSVGLYLFVGTQRPDSEIVGAELKGLFSNRILMGSAGSQATQLTLGARAKFGGALLRVPGRAIVSSSGEQKLTQIYYLHLEHVIRTR